MALVHEDCEVIGSRMRMVISFAGVLWAAVLCVLAVSYKPTKEKVAVKREFEQTVAEGMRNPKTGVDMVRFDACRVEDMKIGMIRIGAFSVLCLDGLVLNLPLLEGVKGSRMKDEDCRMKREGEGGCDVPCGQEAVRGGGLLYHRRERDEAMRYAWRETDV